MPHRGTLCPPIQNTLWPLFTDRVQLPQGWSHFKEAVSFLPLNPQEFLVLLYQPWKDERLSRPWSHLVLLNTGPPDWESSALTTRPLLYYGKHCKRKISKTSYFCDGNNCYSVAKIPAILYAKVFFKKPLNTSRCNHMILIFCL